MRMFLPKVTNRNVVNVALAFCIFAFLGCDDYSFETVSNGTSVIDSESEVNIDTEILGISLRDIPPQITACIPFESNISWAHEGDANWVAGDTVVVGNGTRAECGFEELSEAFAAINAKGRGRIQFNCGSAVNQILLTGPLEVEAGVHLRFDGGMTTVLDGRQAFRILIAHEASDIVFERTIFLDGKARGDTNGGAVFIDNDASSGSAVFSECVFKNNVSVQGFGGAIFANRLARLDISRCVFDQNAAAAGGAVFFYGSHFQLLNSDVYGNQVYQDGGGLLIVEDEQESPSKQFVYCGTRFSNNFSAGNGSGLKITQSSSAQSFLTNSEFVQNSNSEEYTLADGAGALHVRGGKVDLESVSFVHNSSTSSAAGIYLNTDEGFRATNCTFFANESVKGKGGAIFQHDANRGEIGNCSFSQNFAQTGAAIYREQVDGLEISNSIFVDNFVEGTIPGSCNHTFLGEHNFQWVNGFGSLSNLCTYGTNVENAFLMSPRDNGGFVMTCSLDSMSSARNVGEICPRTDARGVVRSIPCDAGAYEVLEK